MAYFIGQGHEKKELAQIAGVSTYTINKLNKNENVTVEVLGKICRALNCTLDDIMEFEEAEKQKQEIQSQRG